MCKWIGITWVTLSLIVLMLISLMVINTEISLKYEINELLDTTDTVYIETAEKYFKFRIEVLTEFAIYVVVNIILIVVLFEKKRNNRLINITWTVLSVTVLLQLLSVIAITALSYKNEMSELTRPGFDSVTLDVASNYLKGTITTLKEFALYVLINIILITITLLAKNDKQWR